MDTMTFHGSPGAELGVKNAIHRPKDGLTSSSGQL